MASGTAANLEYDYTNQAQRVELVAGAGIGDSGFPLPSTLPGVATVLTSTAGHFGAASLINLTSAPVYLEIWDTTGAVTLGTTAPTYILPIPANATAVNGSASNLSLPNGGKIANGMKYCIVTGAYGATPVTTGVSGTIWGK